jgi:peptidyl-prolyl cis-trans isomerase SurA
VKKSWLKLVSLAAIIGSASPALAERVVVDRVVAVIEDEVITLRELETKAEPFLAQLSKYPDKEQRQTKAKEIMRQVLDNEIAEKIVAREIEANKDRLGVTDKDVDRTIDEVLKMNHIDRDGLQATLYGQGVTWSEYRVKLREQIERARLIQFKVQGRVQIKEPDVKRRCEERQKGGGENQVCAAHILIAVPATAKADEVERMHARASRLQGELAAGADFSAYAMRESDDKSAPDGKLGCFGKGDMVEEFEKAAFATKIGDISPVVKTEFGFHIIKVLEKRSAAAGACSSDDDLAPFRNELYQEEMEHQMNAWIDELRKKAFVDVRL